MPIHAPRVHVRRGLFTRTRSRRTIAILRKPRSPPKLAITALLDVLVAVLLFLLVRFESSSECRCLDRWPELPSATTAADVVDASVVKVWTTGANVDGVPVFGEDEARDVAASGRVQRLDGLFGSLKAKREVWKKLHAGRPFPGVVALAVDQDVPAVLVKSVVDTAARAGFPHVELLVQRDRR